MSRSFRGAHHKQLDILADRLGSFTEGAAGGVPASQCEHAVLDCTGLGVAPAQLKKGLLEAWDNVCNHLSNPGSRHDGTFTSAVEPLPAARCSVTGVSKMEEFIGLRVVEWTLTLEFCPLTQNVGPVERWPMRDRLRLIIRGHAASYWGGPAKAGKRLQVFLSGGLKHRRVAWVSVLLMLRGRLRSSMQLLASRLSRQRPGVPSPVADAPRTVCMALEMQNRWDFYLWGRAAPFFYFVGPVLHRALGKCGVKLWCGPEFVYRFIDDRHLSCTCWCKGQLFYRDRGPLLAADARRFHRGHAGLAIHLALLVTTWPRTIGQAIVPVLAAVASWLWGLVALHANCLLECWVWSSFGRAFEGF